MYNHNDGFAILNPTISSGSWITSDKISNILSGTTTTTQSGDVVLKTSFNNYNLRENEKMETLYQVIVVTKQKEIIIDAKLVAPDQENAKFNAGVYTTLTEKKLTLSDATVIVTPLGQVKVEEVKGCCKH
ncbi:hypothetical protein SAMN04487895_101634 [Paenibacillus sophorae]|uniref:Uncharacterized protein n=1 Tax=Paenibacillus sophorae TaxID=1333845 RepID=A0A1H8GSV6_9BACL|nr:hypothetical protein [Paenibacillus sophorae]QWU14332.1 hypothetical protein KP014_20715 [Paenibacillus sophorae]SEN47122.1 hypothetical protein SAMN04487895_101634 [Paenibacillus sophorae]